MPTEKGKVESVSLFEKFWNITKEAAKELKKPLAERSLRRKFEASSDSCDDKIIEAENEMTKLLEDIEGFDMNKWLKVRQDKKNAIKTKEEIALGYEEMFGNKLAA